MDDLRGLLVKIGGAMFALVVFAVGMKVGCGACDDPARRARNEMLEMGCERAGAARLTPKFTPCMDRARDRCPAGDKEALLACAPEMEKIRRGAEAGPETAACMALVNCAQGVGAK